MTYTLRSVGDQPGFSSARREVKPSSLSYHAATDTKSVDKAVAAVRSVTIIALAALRRRSRSRSSLALKAHHTGLGYQFGKSYPVDEGRVQGRQVVCGHP